MDQSLSVSSPEPERRWVDWGQKVREVMLSVWPLKVCRRLAEVGLWMRIDLSQPAEARRLESCEKARAETGDLWSVILIRSLAVFGFQILTVWSSLAEAMSLASGDHATALIQRAWALMVWRSLGLIVEEAVGLAGGDLAWVEDVCRREVVIRKVKARRRMDGVMGLGRCCMVSMRCAKATTSRCIGFGSGKDFGDGAVAFLEGGDGTAELLEDGEVEIGHGFFAGLPFDVLSVFEAEFFATCDECWEA